MFRLVPFVQRLYRRYLYNYHESFWATFHKDSLANRIATAYSKFYFNWVIKDTTLLKKVIPTYPIGCKRILLSDNYLQSLVKPNVTVVTDTIQEITKRGVVTKDGTRYEDLDALVLATGFDLAGILTSVKIPEDQMVKDPKQYLGIYSQNAKNLFVMVGSNSGSSHTSIILYIEAQCRHIVNMLTYMKDHSKKTVRVKDDLHLKYNEKLQEKSKKLVFHECSTWYVKDGLNFTVYPYNIHHFEQTVAKASFEDDFVYT
jgi:cation diffusion facilitator CzcD-associated flavoprotein CzcO